ncbi:hypothetical protein B0H13DRAFT_1865726 [Mycena leptocephala]|nr:hypothetical protein B0H13DRAFT_1865726 [Mycena leptocephala]
MFLLCFTSLQLKTDSCCHTPGPFGAHMLGASHTPSVTPVEIKCAKFTVKSLSAAQTTFHLHSRLLSRLFARDLLVLRAIKDYADSTPRAAEHIKQQTTPRQPKLAVSLLSVTSPYPHRLIWEGLGKGADPLAAPSFLAMVEVPIKGNEASEMSLGSVAMFTLRKRAVPARSLSFCVGAGNSGASRNTVRAMTLSLDGNFWVLKRVSSGFQDVSRRRGLDRDSKTAKR